MLMPVAHSRVSTRRPEAGQITAGTRKPGSRAVLAANSAAAEASMRRSSSPRTTPSKCADHRLRAQPAGERGEQLDHPGGEVEGVDVAQEGALDAGAEHLDGDHLAGLAQASRGAPARARRRRPAARSRRRRRRAAGRARSRSRCAPPPSGTAAACPAARVSWAASSGPTTSGRVESSWPNLM